MRFPTEWIQHLKQSVSLVDVASENIDLKKSGKGFMGCCPFHGDRTPSFSVRKDFYYCFGCKKSGDIINFMMDLHGLSFEEACEDLAEKAKITLPENTMTSAEERAQFAKRARIQQAARLHHFAALKYYHQNLIQNSPVEGQNYLKKRGISQDTINKFQVGVSGLAQDGLAQFLVKAKAPLDIAREFGLIRPSQKNPGDYDVFRDRLVFPLIDVRGRVCGFGGRILPSHDTKEVAKYINSAESELFSKSRYLYGLFQAVKSIRDQESVIVVEGYFDVVGLHQGGFENTVATCGTPLTEDHLKTLSRLAKKIIVFFDRDEAGITAIVKAMETALRMGIIVYGVAYDSQLDPDEFLLNGTIDNPQEKMRAYMDKAFPLLDSMIEREMKNSEGNVEARSQAVKRITSWLESFSDPVGKSLRVDQLIKRWNIPSAALGSLAARAQVLPRGPIRQNPGQPPQGRVVTNPAQRQAPRPKINAPDRELLQYFVQFESFGSKFLEARKQLPEKYTLSALFNDTEMKEWIGRIQEDPSGFSKLKMAPESLVGEGISQELRSVILEGLLRETVQGQEAQLDALIKKSVSQIWAQLSQEIRRKMVAAESSQDMKSFEELSKQFLDLQKKLKDFEDSYVTGKTT